MKKLLYAAAALSLCLAACNSNKADNEAETYQGPTTADSLRVALANQDSLLSLMNDVAEGMAQIKQMENILSSTSDLTAESRDRRQEIRDDMVAIQKTLQERRERLAQLEKKLNASTQNNATLQKSIQTLRAQIADQEGTIETLRIELANANIKVQRLTADVDSLNTTVAAVSQEREEAQQHAAAVTSELNACYYAIGTKKELKEHKLIDTGFLRRTKINTSDFEQSYFTRADKRTLTVIDLHATKAKVLTNQPKDSYEITDAANGSKMLQITNPSLFWNASNFLIIQIN